MQCFYLFENGPKKSLVKTKRKNITNNDCLCTLTLKEIERRGSLPFARFYSTFNVSTRRGDKAFFIFKMRFVPYVFLFFSFPT